MCFVLRFSPLSITSPVHHIHDNPSITLKKIFLGQTVAPKCKNFPNFQGLFRP